MIFGEQNQLVEWSFSSGRTDSDPLNSVSLDVVVTSPGGRRQVIPAFWSGEQTWRVRYSSPELGSHRFRTICLGESNGDLHGCEGLIEIEPYEGSNPLLRHGPLRVSSDGRHLQHADGTPFFWLADTWWMGLCKRLVWPRGFQTLTADRVAKGFSVVQIVAGLYPDMAPFDGRGRNEGGFPWSEDFSQINPAYFDWADLRIAYLVEAGLVPCVVGHWGYFMDFAGLDVLRKHWRYLVARWGAYPVVWCTAGEAMMPFYLAPGFPKESETAEKKKRSSWTELIRSIRSIDPYRRPITIAFGTDQTDDPSVLDFYMIGGSHSGYSGLAAAVDRLEEALVFEPGKPSFIGETHYEGIGESSREEMQRFMFWTCMLSGAMGHTYGANGIWQVNTREQPFGPSPHGTAWGNLPWEEAYRLPGSGQLGAAKRLLERYPWWRFAPRPDWVEPHHTPDNRLLPYAGGIPEEVRIVFVPSEANGLLRRGHVAVTQLEPGVVYRGYYYDPKLGDEYDLGSVTGDHEGCYAPPTPPIIQDWVIVLERTR